jgi:1-acyl-sn-glycerol-3-phosphate acyltransferase
MILLRSLIYVVYLYLTMTLLAVISLPLVFTRGRAAAAKQAAVWGRAALFGARIICGITYEVRGAERLPKDAPVLIASKHEAMWETLFFLQFLEGAAIVLKKELLALPVYGWYARKLEMISIDRSMGASALKDMTREALNAQDESRPVVIFPEGTRQAPGAPPDYKPGIAMLYKRLGLPCYPVALNSGYCWAANGVIRRPGHIVVEVLEPIPPGLSREAFMRELESRIETACARLNEEAKPGAQASQTVAASA